MRHLLALTTILSLGVVVSLTGCSRNGPLGPTADAKEALAIREVLKAGAPAGDDAAAGSAEPTAATGWATITGAFKFVGTAPPKAAIKTNEECSSHPVNDESIVVGPDGGLENVVIFVRTPKVPVNPDYADSASKEVVLDNKDCRFEPHVLVIQTGQNLLVKNSDKFAHNTNIQPRESAQSNAILPAGDKAEQKFPKEEQVPVKVGCNIHSWMGAWIVVRDNPYAAVSNAKGEFTLKNLPAGRELEFQLWQEKAAGLKGVEIAGAPVKVDAKGRFKLKLEPDQNIALTISVPADAIK